MKKLFRINVAILFATSMLIINGCKKGKDGEPGKDGSSTVISKTFSISSGSWVSTSSRWYVSLTVPELTTSNINSAAVQVFFGSGNNNWVAMPFTEVATSNYFMGFETDPNYIKVTWENNVGLGSNPNSFYSLTTVQFKVVVIPPSARMANPNVDLNNYSELSKAFNLKN